MLFKQLPRTVMNSKYFKFDFRAGPKTPPFKFAGGHIQHPIGIEPIEDIVVAGDCDETRGTVGLFVAFFADGFSDRG